MQMSDTISIGVIGAGGMGARHARNLHARVAGARLAAVMDVDGARAQAVAAACGNPQVFDDARALIQSPSVEAVVIASPNSTHAPLTLECLRQGKPVLCEKPLATNADDACQILDAELQLGRRLVQVGFMRRYDPQHVAVKRAVESGAIGRPVLFKGWHRNVGGESSVQSESVVIGSAIHDLDSARWLTGQEIEDVFVRGVCTEPISSPGAWDLQVIQMTMSGGCLATIEVYVNARYGYDVGVEIVGDQGTAQTTPSARAVVRRNLAQAQAVERDWLERFDTAYISELQNWSDTLRRGDPPSGPSAWDGYTSLLAAEACIKSIRSGQVERLPLQESPVLYKR